MLPALYGQLQATHARFLLPTKGSNIQINVLRAQKDHGAGLNGYCWTTVIVKRMQCVKKIKKSNLPEL